MAHDIKYTGVIISKHNLNSPYVKNPIIIIKGIVSDNTIESRVLLENITLSLQAVKTIVVYTCTEKYQTYNKMEIFLSLKILIRPQQIEINKTDSKV